MKRTELPPQLQALLSAVPYVAVASTCPDGHPWNSPLAGFFDDDLNLYWASDLLSQHSKNITQCPNVFVVIYDTRATPPDVFGVYLEMRARCLGSPREIAVAKEIYTDRYGEDEADHVAFQDLCPRRIYKAELIHLWANVDGTRKEHFVDVREPISVIAK